VGEGGGGVGGGGGGGGRGWWREKGVCLKFLVKPVRVYSRQSVDPPPLCRLALGPAPLPVALQAQALEAVWAVEFKMHIEDAGALPTVDHVEVLPNPQLQLVARLPHIQFAAGPAPDSINNVAGCRSQDLVHVKTNSRLGVTNVGKTNKTDLRYPKRFPPGLFFI